MAVFSRNKTPAPRRRMSAPSNESASKQSAFKRNRTLTGSVSSSVVSASEDAAGLKSARTHAHDLVRTRRKIGSALAIVVATLAVLWAVIYQFTASPIVSSLDKSLTLDSARYQDAIDDYLGSRPTERFRFALNQDRLNSYITSKLPEVKSVKQLGYDSLGKSDFGITVRKPVASWMIGSSQNFVDNSGVAFQKNYYTSPSVTISDQSGVEQTPGTAVASSRFLNFVGRAVSTSATYNLQVQQAIIPAGTTRQVELRLKDHDYPIKLSLDRPIGEQIEDMERTVAYLDVKKITPKYIDVRVSGKAFYK